jgi:hypothetical protein
MMPMIGLKLVSTLANNMTAFRNPAKEAGRIALAGLICGLASGCAPGSALLTQTGFESANATEARLAKTNSFSPEDIREAHLAIETLAEEPTNPKNRKSVLAILHSAPKEVRGQIVRLIDGGADKITTRYLLRKMFITNPDRANFAALIEETAPYRVTNEIIVISDVDDTVVPHKGESDTPHIFPGVLRLYQQFDLGPDRQGIPGDLHFVTARDGIVVNGARALEPTGLEVSSVRHGELWSGALSLLKIEGPVEEKKVSNVSVLVERNPTGQLLLFGDSTQADARVYVRILDRYPKRVKWALIHQLDGYPVPKEIRKHERILIFSDYLEAANQLHDRGVITQAQLEIVKSEF